MPERLKKGLRALETARLVFAEVPSSWTRMRVPEMDEARQRDAALKELGEWFIKNFVVKVERKFMKAIWTKSRELLDEVGKSDPQVKADFEHKPHTWYSHKVELGVDDFAGRVKMILQLS